MPRPPDYDLFNEVKFITNYFLAGCEPPFHLVVDFSQEPAKDLALILLPPDLEDIAQAIFEPKQGRRRKPGRHGRKRRKGFRLSDLSDVAINRVRGSINPFDALNWGPFRRIFPIFNIVEGVNFAAAVVDGVTDVGFETLWGVLTVDLNQCVVFPRLARRSSAPQFGGGAGPIPEPIGMSVVEFSSGFGSTPLGCDYLGGKFRVMAEFFITNGSGTDTQQMSVALATQGGQIRDMSYVAGLGPGDSVNLKVSAEFNAGEGCAWGLGDRDGFVTVISCNMLAYGIQGFPLPWEA